MKWIKVNYMHHLTGKKVHSEKEISSFFHSVLLPNVGQTRKAEETPVNNRP
jgi:hypothetical protein